MSCRQLVDSLDLVAQTRLTSMDGPDPKILIAGLKDFRVSDENIPCVNITFVQCSIVFVLISCIMCCYCT